MAKVPAEARVRQAKKASNAALEALANKYDPYKDKFGRPAVAQTLSTAATAKQRCTNPTGAGFPNYGGRGIKFGFPSVRAFMEWVLDTLGERPSSVYSIDRIDNDRHYEPGNLRWATRTEQARNKRAYKRTKNGERIRELKEQRPDLVYETLRLWITYGLTNDEILNRRKYARTCI